MVPRAMLWRRSNVRHPAAFDEITVLLGCWSGFEIRRVKRNPGGTVSGAPQITIELSAVPTVRRYCADVGRRHGPCMNVTTRRVRELPILDAETWLLVPLARVDCPRYGPTIEGLPWLDRYSRMTSSDVGYGSSEMCRTSRQIQEIRAPGAGLEGLQLCCGCRPARPAIR